MNKALIVLPLLALVNTSPATAATETAVLAGGCFWGMEAVFEHVKGVRNVVSGYAGGAAREANYRAVSSERTAHAEAIRVTYDPAQVSYGQLLKIYVTVAHDPTQVDRQGPDIGRSYRSAIFPQNAGQQKAAAAFLQSLERSGAYKKPIATRIESGRFYLAEAEHQDFVRRNPLHPYVLIHDRPKLSKLKSTYPAMWRS
jgi:peptide-methionine (S)-S-oxide reductase